MLIIGHNQKEKKERKKFALLPRIKLSSIKRIICKTLTDIHEEFTLVINEERNCLRLKNSIRTKNSLQGDVEKDRLIEHGNRIGIHEILKQNDRQSLNLKTKV